MDSDPFSSPQWARTGTIVPATPEAKGRDHDIFDEDELAVGGESSRFFVTQPTQVLPRGTQPTLPIPRETQPTLPVSRETQPTQLISLGLPSSQSVSRETQPTQILERPAALSNMPADFPSSPSHADTVEVMRSSPYQPKPSNNAPPNKPNGGGPLRPVGTAFQRPPHPPNKRLPADAVVINLDDDKDDDLVRLSDSSDDEKEAPMRGSMIRCAIKNDGPSNASSFTGPTATRLGVAAVSSSAARPTAPASQRFESARFQRLVENLWHQIGKKRDKEACKRALMATKGNINDAKERLRDEMGFNSSGRTLDDDASESSITVKRAAVEPSNHTAPPPKRRRLVQGLKRRGQSSQQAPSQSPQPSVSSSSASSEAIDSITISDDEGDDYGYAASPGSAQDDIETRVLKYLNECDVNGLVSISKTKREHAEAVIKNRPFSDLDAARRVSMIKKSARKKSSRVQIGDGIVDTIEEYTQALSAIDEVIRRCDQRGSDIHNQICLWNMDFVGTVLQGSVDDQQPLTPSSADGKVTKLRPLPISKEPSFMQGHCEMKSYQLYGLNWMHLLYKRRFGCILADDMGLGKTCQVISLVSHIVETRSTNGGNKGKLPWPNLIVVPPSTLANWQAEFAKFSPKVNVTTYSGPQMYRDELAQDIIDNPEKHHVVLTSYTQLGRPSDIEAMRLMSPNIAVFDEGHKMKNGSTKLYRELMKIRPNWRMLLTGTPVQNNIMEMVSLLNFVEPELFARHLEHLETLFKQKVTLQDVSNGALLYSERVSRARGILEPFILQRRKDQVLKSLPKKTVRVVYCDLYPEQEAIHEEFKAAFKEGKDVKKSAGRLIGGWRHNDQNNPWIQLRKSALHAHLFRRHYDDAKVKEIAKILMRKVSQKELRQDKIEHLTQEILDGNDFDVHLWCRDYSQHLKRFDLPGDSWLQSGKVQALLELVREFQKTKEKVLVFTRWAQMIKILSEVLAIEGIRYCALEGGTETDMRQGVIDDFNEDEDIPVFLLTTAAGGTGINLTSANKVVIFDQSDNPQDDIQAENRAHRLGQKRDVEVIKLITKGTIEELILSACQKKIDLANMVTGRDEQTSKQVEVNVQNEVRNMLVEKENMTPPKSGGEEESE